MNGTFERVLHGTRGPPFFMSVIGYDTPSREVLTSQEFPGETAPLGPEKFSSDDHDCELSATNTQSSRGMYQPPQHRGS